MKKIIYAIVDGVEMTQKEFLEAETQLSDNRQFVQTNFNAFERETIPEYEEMTDGQLSDYENGLRE
jgi:hypothetical protein